MRCVIFWCALNIPHAHGVSQTLFDTSMGVCVASNCCAAAFLGCLVVFLSFHATITCDVWYSTCDASSSGVHSTFHLRLVFPKHSVILLWFFQVLLIAALLLYLALTIIFMRTCNITITCPNLELSRSQRPWRGTWNPLLSKKRGGAKHSTLVKKHDFSNCTKSTPAATTSFQTP